MEENEQVMSDEIREEVEWCNIRWFDGADTGKRVLLTLHFERKSSMR